MLALRSNCSSPAPRIRQDRFCAAAWMVYRSESVRHAFERFHMDGRCLGATGARARASRCIPTLLDKLGY